MAVRPGDKIVRSGVNCARESLVRVARQLPKYITGPHVTEGARKRFYTQVELDIDEFLQQFEDRPTMQPPISGVHPATLRDTIAATLKDQAKLGEGLSLESPKCDCVQVDTSWLQVRVPRRDQALSHAFSGRDPGVNFRFLRAA